MVEMFAKFLRQGGLSKEVNIAAEVETGYGIADLVLYSLDDKHQIKISNFSKIPQRFAVLLSKTLNFNKFTLETFSAYTGANEQSSKRILNNLVGLGVAKKIEENSFEIFKYGKSPVSKIISIEAKLSNWKRALDQAYRYKEFSHQSWVLLDHSKIDGALKNIERFQNAGIGLASFSTMGELFILFSPKDQLPGINTKYWSASVVLAKAKIDSTKDHLSLV